MKTSIKFIPFIMFCILIAGCTQKPVKTIENLKAAFNGESTASAKYAAFAEKALAEGFDTVAVMFMAISKAEAVHAENHKKVLEKLGEMIESPQLGDYQVLTTSENLAAAAKGEANEIQTMYPGFIEIAKNEKSNDAVKTFTWAVDTEMKHQVFYENALAAVNAGSEKGLAFQWFVCLVCGNTYDLPTVASVCDFCMTPKEKFLVF